MPRNSLWRSAGPLVAGRAASAFLGFALPAVLARTLDQAGYGTYKELYLVTNLALYSLQLGLAQSLFYFVPRAADERERRAYVGQTQLALTVVGLLTAFGIFAAAPLVAAHFSNPALAQLAAPMAVLAGALIASSPLEIALTARGRPGASALALVGTDVVRIAAMLVPVATGHGVEGLAWGAAGAAVLRWALSSALSHAPGALSPSWSRLATQLAYALPFGAAVLLAMPQQQLHQVFVAGRLEPAAFAIYAVGCMQIPVVSLLYSPVSETLQVRLAALERSGETHRAGPVFADAVDKLALVFFPMCALLMAASEPILRVLYGEAYAPSASVMQVAVLSVAVSSLPLDGVLKARARTGTLLATYAVKLAITWPLVASGFAAFGMEGAIGAHVLVEALVKAGQLAIVARELKTPVRELLGGATVLRSALLATAVFAASWALVEAIPHPLVACFAAGAGASAIMGAELWRRRRLPRDETAAEPRRAA